MKVFGAIFAVGMLTVIPPLAFGLSVLIMGNEMSIVTTILQPTSYLSTVLRSVIYPILEAYMTYETRHVIKNFCSACVRRHLYCKKNSSISDRNMPTTPPKQP